MMLLLVLSVLINALGMHISLDVSDNLPQHSALRSNSSQAPEGPAGLRAKTEVSLLAFQSTEVFDHIDENHHYLSQINFYFQNRFPENRIPEENLRPPIALV